MVKIGTLSYDINGNDNLKKILEDDKAAALELKKVIEQTSLAMGKVNLTQLKQYNSILAKYWYSNSISHSKPFDYFINNVEGSLSNLLFVAKKL